MSGWESAVRAAWELQEAHPDWTVRPARRRDGPGLEAVCEGRAAMIGPVAEVRAELSREERSSAA